MGLWWVDAFAFLGVIAAKLLHCLMCLLLVGAEVLNLHTIIHTLGLLMQALLKLPRLFDTHIIHTLSDL